VRVRAPVLSVDTTALMKILHVIPALTRGGAERVVIDLANDAAERGHDVSILCAVASSPELLPQSLRPDVGLRYISSLGLSQRWAYPLMPLWLARNRKWLFRHDVIHCHLTGGSIFGTLLQALRRVHPRPWPVVVETYHAVGMAISNWQRGFHAALLSKRDAVAFMADDPYWTRFRRSRPNRLFRTIPNGIVPLSAVSTAAAEQYRRGTTDIPDAAFVVGSIGRLVPARRPDLLLDTFARLVRISGQPLHLLLAGEGPLRRRLEARARAHGIADRVHLPGLVFNPGEALGVIDLYLTVNVGATAGIAALEAAFAGVPVVALQLQQGYANGANEWIPSFCETDELARRAAELIGDRAALKRLAAAQQTFAAAHRGVDAMARAYEDFYRNALGAS